MQRMTKGQNKESSVKRKVQLASAAELKNWTEIGPRSVAAAARYRKQPAVGQQKSAAIRPAAARKRVKP
jgi:hypothetical protein